jgi:GTPase
MQPTPDDLTPPDDLEPTDESTEGDGSLQRVGTIALIGRPNAGKSTLLNAVLGQKLSITSDKPQTTRNRIVGIYTADGIQAVLIDTPGLHHATSLLNRGMVRVAEHSLDEVDAVTWVIDASTCARAAERNQDVLDPPLMNIVALIAAHPELPVTVVLNKIDLIERALLLPVMAAISALMPAADVVPTSASKKNGLKQLIETWRRQLPDGELMFPADQLMDGSERFVVAELIREKVVRLTKNELPYATAVDVEKFDEEDRDAEKPRVVIYASIVVERDSQKGIIIGKGGSMLKRIGSQARKDIEGLLGVHVRLELHVRVNDRWTSNPRMLRELGYDPE